MTARRQIYGRELLRVNVGGQTKNILVLKDDKTTRLFDAHPLVDTFNTKHGTRLTIVSHNVADAALNFKTVRGLPEFTVNVAIAYEKPETRLGQEVVFYAYGEPRVVLATGRFRGISNVALVAMGLSSADFKKDGLSIVLDIPDTRLTLVPNFPGGTNKWYMQHPVTGVPYSKRKRTPGPDARFIIRVKESPYVGLLVRNFHGFYDSERNVSMDHEASDRLGVVVEVPDADVAKITELIAAESK